MQQRFLLQILMLAQHVSGTIMPIIKSSRIIYSGCCVWYLVLWFIYVEIKCQLDATEVFIADLIACSTCSGTTMPIIRSSRVLYSGCCLWYFVLWFIYVEIKCQLDATEVFITDPIACSTCFGHHYAHHQEIKSIIQWLLPVVFGAVVYICGNKMPTRCNRGFYCRSYCLLNKNLQIYFLHFYSTKYHRQQPLYNTLDLLMMGITVSETCWASNKIWNKEIICCI